MAFRRAGGRGQQRQQQQQLEASTYDDPFGDEQEEEEQQQDVMDVRMPSASPPAVAGRSSLSPSPSPTPSHSPPASSGGYVTPVRAGVAGARGSLASAPMLTGRAHLHSLLQSMGKPALMSRSAGSTRPPSGMLSYGGGGGLSSSRRSSDGQSDAAASAFDSLMRSTQTSARASYLADLKASVSDDEEEQRQRNRRQQRAGAQPIKRSAPPAGSTARAPSPSSDSGLPRHEAARSRPSSAMDVSDSPQQQQGSPALFAKSRKRNGTLKPTRSSPRLSPAPAPPVTATSANVAATAASSKERPFVPRALSSSFAESSTSSAAFARPATARAASSTRSTAPTTASSNSRSSSARSSPVLSAAAPVWRPPGRISSLNVSLDDLEDDDLESSSFDLAGTQLADDEDEDDSEGFTFAKDGPVARELAEQKALAEQARFRAAVKKREQAEQARLEKSKRKREEEAKAKAATSSTHAPAEQQLPAAKKPSPLKAPPKRPATPADDDPFDVLSPSPSPSPSAVAARGAPSPPPSASSALPPAAPTVARTSSSPAMPRTLPAHVAVVVGSSRLPPVPPPRVPSPSPGGIPGLPPMPTLSRSHSASELQLQRIENLALKSHSALLLEALLGKTSPELRAVQDAALTPAQKVMLMRPPSSSNAAGTTAAAAAAAAAQPTFASVLASKTGRRLKPKQGEGVGGTAKQRNRARRVDGFIGDTHPLLERTVEYLLANGADPNAADADRNNPLWIALQIKGSEKIVKMLLEKGAECTEALESEDESSDEEEGGGGEGGHKSAMQRASVHENKENSIRGPKIEPYRPAQPTSSVRALRKAGAHPSLPQTLRDLQYASGGAGDIFNFERGSTVDLAMKLGSERQTMMLLKAGHLPHRNGRVRLIDFARLHNFGEYASNFLATHLWSAVRDGDETKAMDMVRHMDKKLIDRQDPTGRTALYAAVEHKDPSLLIVESLLKAGANPNQPDISQTPMAVFPLCRAAKKSTSVLALLLRYGLDPLAEVGDSGQTLLEFAPEAGARAESIALLQEAATMRANKQAAHQTQAAAKPMQPGLFITNSVHNQANVRT